MKWVYGKDDADPSLYDLVINISHIGVEKAVELVTSTVRQKKFQAMTYSTRLMKNIELSCRVAATLIDIDPDIRVRSEDGNVHVHTKVVGVESVEVHMSEDLFDRIAGDMR